MNRKRGIHILTGLLLLLLIINYNFFDNFLISVFNERESIVVERIVDGDTIQSTDGEKIRLLGINTPEKNEIYYEEARDFLEENILNKTIELEFGKDKTDIYNRTLAYLYLDKKNVNLEIVKQGFANFYFPSGKDRHYKDFYNAWLECLKSNQGLCEKSINKCQSCLNVNLDKEKQAVILKNSCEFSCELEDWSIKDEGRKKFVFPGFILEKGRDVEIIVGDKENTNEILFWKDEKYVWTSTGDTFFLRDKNNKLVLWKSY
ncbi:MAG: thermonuclease family protein [Nanoarchaeota archaeon]